jgi:hypothetical protein
MNLTVHIEQLILDGLPVTSHDASLVRAAVEAELTRLFAEQGIAPNWQRGTALPQLQGGSVHIPHDANPPAIGRKIAGAVLQSMSAPDGAKIGSAPSLSNTLGVKK